MMVNRNCMTVSSPLFSLLRRGTPRKAMCRCFFHFGDDRITRNLLQRPSANGSLRVRLFEQTTYGKHAHPQHFRCLARVENTEVLEGTLATFHIASIDDNLRRAMVGKGQNFLDQFIGKFLLLFKECEVPRML